MVKPSLVIFISLALIGTTTPLLYYKWKRDNELAEEKRLLQLLHKVDLIISEIGIRLLHLENQIEEYFYQLKEQKINAKTKSSQKISSYYHFDSNGNKIKTKWDSFNVEDELAKLDDDSIVNTNKSSTQLLADINGIEHELESVLEFLDGIRGNAIIKEERKGLVTKITKDHFIRLDKLRVKLNNCKS